MIKSHFTEAYEILGKFLADQANFDTIEKAGNIMVESLKNGGKIIYVTSEKIRGFQRSTLLGGPT